MRQDSLQRWQEKWDVGKWELGFIIHKLGELGLSLFELGFIIAELW